MAPAPHSTHETASESARTGSATVPCSVPSSPGTLKTELIQSQPWPTRRTTLADMVLQLPLINSDRAAWVSDDIVADGGIFTGREVVGWHLPFNQTVATILKSAKEE